MAKISGLGGYWVIDDTGNPVLHNASYTIDTESLNDDVTTSGSVSFDEGLPIIRHFSATLSTPEEDDSYVELLGLEEGSVVSIWFKRGATSTFDKVTDTIVRSVRHVNDQKRARQLEISVEYGTFERDSGAPT
jgi:hypothetical protein